MIFISLSALGLKEQKVYSGINVCVHHPNSNVEIPTPDGMVFGGGALRNRISILLQQDGSLQLGRGLLTLTLDLQPPELRSTLLLFLSQPVCGVLLQQPEQTKTKYRPSVRPRN